MPYLSKGAKRRLSELRRRCPEATSYLDWAEFAAAAAFCDSRPDPTAMNAVTAELSLSLVGTAPLWSG